MRVRATTAGLEVWSPAKLNLFLEVRGRRADGFHEIETLMCPISLYDRLVFRAGDDATTRIRLSCDWAPDVPLSRREPLPQDERNTICMALQALANFAGREFGAVVQLIKRIPVAAGLGGGSANAAAALMAGNVLWGLRYPLATLARIASTVGSDVAFFLCGSPAICVGRGEIVQPIADIGRQFAVVVKPPMGFSTAQIYQRCQAPEVASNAGPLVAALRSGDRRSIRAGMFNRLQFAAEGFSDWIERARTEFERLGFTAHQMSGSGSSYFGLCRNRREARRLAAMVPSRLFRSRGGGDVFLVESMGVPTLAA